MGGISWDPLFSKSNNREGTGDEEKKKKTNLTLVQKKVLPHLREKEKKLLRLRRNLTGETEFTKVSLLVKFLGLQEKGGRPFAD